MPVQINEVIVRVTVDPAPSAQAGPQTAETSARAHDASTEELLEEVLEIIREKSER